MPPTLTPGFLDAPSGRLFALELAPADGGHGQALILPPFGEEMNRTRRTLFALAERLAERGLAVTLPDLFGTGDSEGTFEQATWSGWLADSTWLLDRSAARAGGPVSLVAMRTGVLLAAGALAARPEACGGLICVQPVTDGKRYLDQVLRTRVAAAMSRGQAATRASFWAQWSEGQTVEVGGYAISPRLAEGLAACRLAEMAPPADLPVVWATLVGGGAHDTSEGSGPPAPAWPDSWARPCLRDVRLASPQIWALAEVPDTVPVGRALADHVELAAAA